MRTDDEKAALHLHRYKSWAAVLDTRLSEITQLQEQLNVVAEHAITAYLEAREEIAELQALGIDDENIQSVAKLPVLPMDPLTLLKRTRTSSGG